MNKDLEKVIDKLRKLQALHEGAVNIGSEAEANSVASKIQNLLLKYNLALVDIIDKADSDIREVTQENVSGYTYKHIGGQWEKMLYETLCEYNFCKVLIRGRSSYKNLILIGDKHNVETVKWLKNMLTIRFLFSASENFKKRSDKTSSRGKFFRSYLFGSVLGLYTKLDEQFNKDKAEYGERLNQLVLYNDRAIELYCKEHFEHIGVANSRRNLLTDFEAQKMGYKDGYNTDTDFMKKGNVITNARNYKGILSN